MLAPQQLGRNSKKCICWIGHQKPWEAQFKWIIRSVGYKFTKRSSHFFDLFNKVLWKFQKSNFKFNFTQEWLFHLWFSLHRVANKCLELIGAQGWPAPYNLPWGPWTPGRCSSCRRVRVTLGVSSSTFTKSEFTRVFRNLQGSSGIYRNLQGSSEIYRNEFYRCLLSLSQKVNLQGSSWIYRNEFYRCLLSLSQKVNLQEFTGAFRNLQGLILQRSSFTFKKKWIYRNLQVPFQEFTGMNFTRVFFHFHKKWIYRNLQGSSGIYRNEFYRCLLSLSQKVNLQEFIRGFRNLQEWILHVSSFTFTKSEFTGDFRNLQGWILQVSSFTFTKSEF